jgi:hypothetical protein
LLSTAVRSANFHQFITGSFYVVDANGNPISSDGYLWNQQYAKSQGYLWNNGYLWNQSAVAPASSSATMESWNVQE